MLAELLEDPAIQERIERKMEFWHPEFVPGAYVSVRYVRDEAHRYGRIVAIRAKGSKQDSSNPFPVLEIRMETGEIRFEHPEHLCEADAPQPPQSDLVSSLFEMLCAVGTAQAAMAKLMKAERAEPVQEMHGGKS